MHTHFFLSTHKQIQKWYCILRFISTEDTKNTSRNQFHCRNEIVKWEFSHFSYAKYRREIVKMAKGNAIAHTACIWKVQLCYVPTSHTA